MPRGAVLTEVERDQILALRKDNFSLQAIADALHRSKTVVHAFLKDPDNYNTKKRSGRPRLLDEQARTRLLQAAAKGQKSAAQLASELALGVKRRTIQRELQRARQQQQVRRSVMFGVADDSENATEPAPVQIPTARRLTTPVLSQEVQEQRMQWAQRMLKDGTVWDNVVFSGEKQFNLDGPDPFVSHWSGLQSEGDAFRWSKGVDGTTESSVVVWLAFSALGKAKITFLSSPHDPFSYQQTLTTCLFPLSDDTLDGNYLFQHDVDAVRHSPAVTEFLTDLNVKLIEWPSYGADVNPIEDVWAAIAQVVYVNGMTYQNLDELKQATALAWDSVRLETLGMLVATMPQRCTNLVDRRGRLSAGTIV
ncbi:TPA: hypothetical protein N0F65_003778 [Lagenidium giganteum]|uniref:Tc3 transposase DNA binding domain-containing protein n=1 Tax=Lagenidium giganteum TaxID=4803 RepID=A0AAV2YDR8_9STRA|nr:TPA: hypothetical protein N0F65_003778 [Lagenidium giganteum]